MTLNIFHPAGTLRRGPRSGDFSDAISLAPVIKSSTVVGDLIVSSDGDIVDEVLVESTGTVENLTPDIASLVNGRLLRETFGIAKLKIKTRAHNKIVTFNFLNPDSTGSKILGFDSGTLKSHALEQIKANVDLSLSWEALTRRHTGSQINPNCFFNKFSNHTCVNRSSSLGGFPNVTLLNSEYCVHTGHWNQLQKITSVSFFDVHGNEHTYGVTFDFDGWAEGLDIFGFKLDTPAHPDIKPAYTLTPEDAKYFADSPIGLRYRPGTINEQVINPMDLGGGVQGNLENMIMFTPLVLCGRQYYPNFGAWIRQCSYFLSGIERPWGWRSDLDMYPGVEDLAWGDLANQIPHRFGQPSVGESGSFSFIPVDGNLIIGKGAWAVDPVKLPERYWNPFDFSPYNFKEFQNSF